MYIWWNIILLLLPVTYQVEYHHTTTPLCCSYSKYEIQDTRTARRWNRKFRWGTERRLGCGRHLCWGVRHGVQWEGSVPSGGQLQVREHGIGARQWAGGRGVREGRGYMVRAGRETFQISWTIRISYWDIMVIH